MSKYYFVIDTDTYAGNFERELCAYLTGRSGECGVGCEFVDLAMKELTTKEEELFENWVALEPDEHGCHRPVKIYPTPGYFNNGLGFNYKAGQEAEAIEAYRQYCIKEANQKPYAKKKDNDAHRKHWQQMADNAANEYGRFPSYQSVAIAFEARPGQDLIDLMKARTHKFVANIGYGEWAHFTPFTVLGFRVVEEITTTVETAV